MNDHYEIEVIIRGSLKNGGFRLKVSCLGLGMYIDGFRATRSNKNQSGWWIQQPSFKMGISGYKPSPEFDRNHPFWLEIERSCIESVENTDLIETEPVSTASIDEELTEEAIRKGIDEAWTQLSIDDNSVSKPPKRRYHE